MKYVPPYGAPGDDDPYVNGDPSIARQGSIIPAAAVEHPQREIVSVIERSNDVPDDGDLEQLTKSFRSQFVNFCVDTGSINNLSVALDPPLTAYRQGLPLRVLVGNNNTGACVINVNSLGGRPIRRPNGSELLPNDLVAGMIASIVDDGNAFQLQNFQASGGDGGGGGPGDIINNYYETKIPYAEDVSTLPNLITANFTPAITAVVPGDVVVVKVKNTNDGAVQIKINGLAEAPLRRNDAQPLQGKDILADEAILIEYNTTYWQMLRLVRSQVWLNLTADLILDVRPDGDDSNDGSANNPSFAFKTIMGAVRFVQQSWLIAGRTVLIQLGIPGTYEGSVTVDNLPGSLIIQGDAAAMNSYIVLGDAYVGPSVRTQVLLVRGSGSNVMLAGVTLSGQSPVHNMVDVENNATLHVTNCAFSGVTTTGGALTSLGAEIILSNYIHQFCGLGYFAGAYNGSVSAGLWFTQINTHNQAYSLGFCYLHFGYGVFLKGYCQFTGGATGNRYRMYLNSGINTDGGGSAFLPGSINGFKDDSSAYR